MGASNMDFCIALPNAGHLGKKKGDSREKFAFYFALLANNNHIPIGNSYFLVFFIAFVAEAIWKQN